MCGAVPSCSHLCTPPLLCCVGSFALVHWPDRGGLLLGESPLPLFYWPAAALLLHISPLFVSSAVLATPSYGDKKSSFSLPETIVVVFQYKKVNGILHYFTCTLLSHCWFHRRVFAIPDDIWHSNFQSLSLKSALQRKEGNGTSDSVIVKWFSAPTCNALFSAWSVSSGGCAGEHLVSPDWQSVYGQMVGVKGSIWEYSKKHIYGSVCFFLLLF